MKKPLDIYEAIDLASSSNLGYTDDDTLVAELGGVSLGVDLSNALDTYNDSECDTPFIEFVKQDLKETLDCAIKELASL